VKATAHFLANSASLSADAHRNYQTRNQSFRKQFDKNEGQQNVSRGGFRKMDRNEGNRASLFCNYCRKAGHLINKCYKLHGFPPNFKFTKGRKLATSVQHYEENFFNDNIASD